VAADGGIDSRDVLAIVSMLVPVAILAGTAIGLHPLIWWGTHDSMPGTPWWQRFSNVPMGMIWLVVAMLGIAGLRRAAAVGAWVGTTGFVLRAILYPAQYWWTTSWHAGWVLLGLLTAVALTWPPGPARAREFVNWRVVVLITTTVVAVVMIGFLAYRKQLVDWRLLVLAIGSVAACRLWSRTGRRVALVLMVPAMIVLLGRTLLVGLDAPIYNSPSVTVVALCYGVPVVVLLTLGGAPRRVRQQT
jgi:hypothetical protein